jgi:hypothetical protein
MLRGFGKALLERIQAKRDARIYNRAGMRLIEAAENRFRSKTKTAPRPLSEREEAAIQRHLERSRS